MSITIREVAKEAGVSVSTVSYVLAQREGRTISTATQERVLSAARRLNYRYNAIAADLRRGATRVVGIQIYSLAVPILSRKIAALQQGLRQAGLYPFLCYATDADAEQTFFKECVSRRVAGVVLTAPPCPEGVPYLLRLKEQDAVLVASEPMGPLDIPYVSVDWAEGAETAVGHLMALGHCRIGAVLGQGSCAFREGYRRALAAGGAAFDAQLVVWLSENWGCLYDSGGQAAEQLLALTEPPTAIVTTDDEVAIGVLRGLQRRGLRVPDDVALVGCDDIPVAAHAGVPLTTLAQPAEEQGARLAKLLQWGLEDPGRIAGFGIALPMQLVVRESCGARRSTAMPHG